MSDSHTTQPPAAASLKAGGVHDIPLAVPDLRGREAELLQECVRDNWVSSAGPHVTRFEKAIADLAGRREAVACVNGTAALTAALSGLGIGAGDLVIVPDWTFAATANAVVHAGAAPIFADVSVDDWCLDPDSAATAMKRHGDRIKAAIVVDPSGKVAAPSRIAKLQEQIGCLILEDAAGAIGARREGAAAGSLGHVSTFSFNGNKTVTAGGGGMIVTDDTDLAVRVRHLTTQARVGQDYRHDAIGFNFRMTNLNAALGLAQLERLDDMIAAKRALAKRYKNHIAGRNDLRFMPFDSGDGLDSGWLSNVMAASEKDARSLLAHLASARIGARMFWCSLSAQAPYSTFHTVDVPVSRLLTDRVVSLPSSSQLTDEEMERVLAALDGWRGTAMAAA